jgi:CubicO group peptidase (beta-lactamase class C family)
VDKQIIKFLVQMYVTAAHIVSTYAGSFTTFVKERIFDPLNMTSTTYSLSEAVRSGEITQAWTSMANGRRIPHWFDDEVNQLIAGAGGIISSAADMVCDCHVVFTSLLITCQAKWVEANLNSGINKHTSVTVIPGSAFEEITTAHFVINGPERVLLGPDSAVVGYGAGWGRTWLYGHDVGYNVSASTKFGL